MLTERQWAFDETNPVRLADFHRYEKAVFFVAGFIFGGRLRTLEDISPTGEILRGFYITHFVPFWSL